MRALFGTLLQTAAGWAAARRWLALVLLTALCSDCGPGVLGPGADSFLAGRVLDPMGNPVRGVSISLVYAFEPTKPGNGAGAFGVVPAFEPQDLTGVLLRYEVFDYLGRRVRLLVDNPTGAAVPGPVTWREDDDRGEPVPNGFYMRRLVFRYSAGGPTQTASARAVIHVTSTEELLTRRHAVTDADGVYRIPIGLLPVGEPLRVSDDTGDTHEMRVSSRVQLYALQRRGNDTVAVHKDLFIDQPRTAVNFDLTMP